VDSAEELRGKYKNLDVSIDAIEEVDFIWHGEPLSVLIGQEECYDWIIASHVIEHVPDVVTFLAECEKLLKPSGVLSLVIPDKRFCFDYFHSTTSTGEILDAFDQKRTRPSPGKVFDFCARIATSNDRMIWGPDIGHNFQLFHNISDVYHSWQEARTSEKYIDVHLWRFTPPSFRLLLADLRTLGLAGFGIKKEFDTTGCEFYVTLGKNPDNLCLENSNRMELLKRIREDDETTN
jgi:SAM-dependent methyltransferase